MIIVTPTMCKALLSVLYKLIESSQQLWVVGMLFILQGNWSTEMLENLSTQQGNAGAGPSTQAVWLQQPSPFPSSTYRECGGRSSRPLLLSCTSVQWYLGLMEVTREAGSALQGKCWPGYWSKFVMKESCQGMARWVTGSFVKFKSKASAALL